MELGPIQKQWVAELRAHPEQQLRGTLGSKQLSGEEQMCCLGKGGLIAGVCKWNGSKLETKGNRFNSVHLLSDNTYKKLGLYSEMGKLKEKIIFKDIEFWSLANLNDNNAVTWLDIANIIEKNPENVFAESV